MAITSVLDASRQRLHTTALGQISLRELLDHLDERERTQRLTLPELFDARQATTDLTGSEIRELIERTRYFGRQDRLAPIALVTDNDLVFGMARMFAILSEDFCPRFAVYRDVSSAETWLASTADS